MNKALVKKKLIKAGGINARFDVMKKTLDDEVNSLVMDIVKRVERSLYYRMGMIKVTETDIKKELEKINYEISVATDSIRGKVKDIATLYTDDKDITEKVKTAITNYFTNDYTRDVAGMFISVKDQYEAAMNQLSYAINIQSKKDMEFLISSVQKFENKDLTDNFKSFVNVFKNDYGQQYMNEIMNNPTLSKMIKQEEGGLFYYAKNGKRYDLEKYIEQRSEWATTDITRKAADQFAKESGAEVFKFERVNNFEVKEPRAHSKYEGQLFSDNDEVVEKSNGKILSSKLIDDFEIGGQAPYGCGHAFIPEGF